MSGLKEGKSSPAPESLRRSPATNHGETEGEGGIGVLRRSFRVGGRWKQATGSTTVMTRSSPADGGVGCCWISPRSLPNTKLRRGSERVVDRMITGRIWEEERLGPERIELGPEADRGGRSWGRRPPRVLLVGLAELWGEGERCWR